MFIPLLPNIKIQKIPTLFKYGGSKPIGSLVEDDCKVLESVKDLVEA